MPSTIAADLLQLFPIEDFRDFGNSTSTQALAASDICNEWDEKSLTDILRVYGDEPRAKKIARSIIERRPYETTTDLINAVKAVTPEFAKKVAD